MDPAPSVEAPDGVRLAPPLHRLRPFLGRVVLRESLQGTHELAVDEACRERVELIRDHRHPHLVEQGETFPHVAAQNQEPGLCDPSEGARRRVASRTDLDRAPGPLSRARQVARQHSLVRPDHRKPRVRRRLTLTLQESLGSAQPAAHRCHQGGIEKQVHRDANCRAPCSDLVAGLQAPCMSAFPRVDGHVEVARGVCDLGENR